MPRKQEVKAVGVLRYFETAPLEAAVLVLEMAREAVRKRQPTTSSNRSVATPAPSAPKGKKGTRTAAAATAAPPPSTPAPQSTPLPGLAPVTGGPA